MKQRENAKRTSLLKDNRGSAIVMVLVIIAFISILVSIVCYRAVLNYQMKMVDYKSKDNFYTAENALEEVRTGLQSIASNAIAESYVEVMQGYHNYTNDERAAQFSFLYMLKMRDALKAGGNDDFYNVSILQDYITEPFDPALGVGATVEVDGAVSVDNKMIPYTEALILENVKVTYTDANGFVSIISTDIQINLPAIDFNEAFRMPDILDYCVIANDSLIVQPGTTNMSGSMYAGVNGITVENSTHLKVSDSELIVTDGAITVNSGANLEILDANANTWVKDVELNSASATVRGNLYVADDTTVNGKLSSLTYGGAYYGFGETDTSYGSDGSSAIVINGLGTKINFSGLTTLTLAGNAYISIMDKGNMVLDVGLNTETPVTYDPTDPAATNPFDSSFNVMMGESLSVKSNQLAYLVPAECIGYYGEECLIGCNPVTQDVLNTKFIEPRAAVASDPAKLALYKEVNMDMVSSSLGESLSSLGVSSIRKLYRVEGSTTLVYYYMIFDSQSNANYFFRQYYANNKAKMDSYISNYIDKANSNFGNFDTMNINLAGNVMRQEGTGADASYVLEEDSLAVSTSDPEYVSTLAYYGKAYGALCTKLTQDDSTFTPQEIANKGVGGGGLFANIIDMEVFNSTNHTMYVPGFSGSNQVYFGDADDTYHAMVSKTDYTIGAGFDDSIRIVVAKGDVTVDRDYTGIIIASGKVTVTGGHHVTKDNVGVSKAMQLVNSDGVNEYAFVNLFIEGHALATSTTPGMGNTHDHVEVEELIGYRNWNKQ